MSKWCSLTKWSSAPSALEWGHREWFGGIGFSSRCQVWDPNKRSRKRKMGHCGHRPGLPGTAGALLPAPNFVGLAPQGTRSSSLRAQAGDFRGRAGLGRRRPVGSLPERASGGCDAGRGAWAGRGLAAPPPPRGAPALPTAARRPPQPAPAAPSQPSRPPRPRPAPPGRTPAGGLGPRRSAPRESPQRGRAA